MLFLIINLCLVVSLVRNDVVLLDLDECIVNFVSGENGICVLLCYVFF